MITLRLITGLFGIELRISASFLSLNLSDLEGRGLLFSIVFVRWFDDNTWDRFTEKAVGCFVGYASLYNVANGIRAASDINFVIVRHILQHFFQCAYGHVRYFVLFFHSLYWFRPELSVLIVSVYHGFLILILFLGFITNTVKYFIHSG